MILIVTISTVITNITINTISIFPIRTVISTIAGAIITFSEIIIYMFLRILLS